MRQISIFTALHLLVLSTLASATETRTVVAGPQYKKGGVHKLLFGADYRALWTTPATFELLDLQSEAGGLSPVARIGGQQTKGLALKGRDGRNYTFRGLDKDASEILDEDLRDTIVDSIVEDAQSGQHPASEVVVRGLSEAASIPCPPGGLSSCPTIRRSASSARSSRARSATLASTRAPSATATPASWHHGDCRSRGALPPLAGRRGRPRRRPGAAQGRPLTVQWASSSG